MNSTSNANSNSTHRNIGIDVGKANLDIFIYERNLHWQEANTKNGIASIIKQLNRYKLSRVVVEATGGYERMFVEACVEKGLPVIVIQPMQIRKFAQAQGIYAKTDKIDARVIARFGAIMQPEVRPLPTQKIRYIKDLLARKRQLNKFRTQELNRIQKTTSKIAPSHRRLIRAVEKDIEWVTSKLNLAIEEVTEWKRTYEILTAVPGIGDGVAHTLLGELPELGSLTSRQVAALTGLTPYNRDSGTLRGKRRIKGGRAPIRTMLYMAMMCAIQHNSIMKRFYKKLVASGKHKKVALTACMRKMMTILNAMVRDNREWQHIN